MNTTPHTLELTVVLPAYLEEKNLTVLLPRLHESLELLEISYEIIIVDAILPIDLTKQVCKKKRTPYFDQSTIYLNREKGNSFGDAVRTGIKYSRGKFVVFMDADGAHLPEFIKNIYPYRNTYDIVIASRYASDGSIKNFWPWNFIGLILNVIYSRLLGVRCRDISSRFKLYRGDWLRSLQLRCEYFDITEEIMEKLIRKYPYTRIKEVRTVFKNRLYNKKMYNFPVFMFKRFINFIRPEIYPKRLIKFIKRTIRFTKRIFKFIKDLIKDKIKFIRSKISKKGKRL